MRRTLVATIAFVLAASSIVDASDRAPDSYLSADARIAVSAALFSIATDLTRDHGRNWRSLPDAVTHAAPGPRLDDAPTPDGLENLRFGGVINFFLAGDEHADLDADDDLSWHLHARLPISEWITPAVELNSYHVVDGGRQRLPFRTADVVSSGIADLPSVVTLGIGAEIRPSRNLALRTAYELPLNYTDDVVGHRWTVSLVISF